MEDTLKLNHEAAKASVSFVGYEIECSECGLVDTNANRRAAAKIQHDHLAWHAAEAAKTAVSK